MIALDTNVLIRYFIQDDPAQSRKARQFIEENVLKGKNFFIPGIVVCELVWVLSSAYNVMKSEIVDLLEKVAHVKHFNFEDREVLCSSIDGYKSGRGDFSDYYLKEISKRQGSDRVMTFDKVLLKESYFKAP